MTKGMEKQWAFGLKSLARATMQSFLIIDLLGGGFNFNCKAVVGNAFSGPSFYLSDFFFAGLDFSVEFGELGF